MLTAAVGFLGDLSALRFRVLSCRLGCSGFAARRAPLGDAPLSLLKVAHPLACAAGQRLAGVHPFAWQFNPLPPYLRRHPLHMGSGAVGAVTQLGLGPVEAARS